jgi:uncharacterized phage protein (TIGR02218 family)
VTFHAQDPHPRHAGASRCRITRRDGAQFFFTDHDRDIVFGGDTYRADAGFERTAIRSDAGFAVDNLDLVGVFAEGGIVEDEVRAGLFDGAEIALSFVNWEDPDTYGEIRLRRGTLGEVRLTPQGHFTAELRGLSQPLAQSTLQIYGPACRADLGDARCKFPIKPPVLGREQAVQLGEFYRVATAEGTGFQVYEDRIYEVTAAGTTDAEQPVYDTTIGNPTTDGTAVLTARDSFMRVAMVDAVTSNRVLVVDDALDAYPDSWFSNGALTFETGANAGRTIEVKGWTQGTRTLELWEPARLPLQSGDQFRVYAGCHKRIKEDCRDKFQIPGSLLFADGNAGNFRGEPSTASPAGWPSVASAIALPRLRRNARAMPVSEAWLIMPWPARRSPSRATRAC